jgi:hypothetical protein
MATTTTEIPKQEWQPFCDGFSQAYTGWRTTIEVMGKDLGDQQVARDEPFQGISFDTAGTGAGNMEIGVGEKPDHFATHFVDHPRHMRVADTRAGTEVDMEIEAADGTKYLLHLTPSPALPPKG